MHSPEQKLEGPGHEQRLETLQEKFKKLNEIEIGAVQSERKQWLHRPRVMKTPSTALRSQRVVFSIPPPSPPAISSLPSQMSEKFSASEDIATQPAQTMPAIARSPLKASLAVQILVVMAVAAAGALAASVAIESVVYS